MLKTYLKNLDNKEILELINDVHGYDLASDFLTLDEIEKVLILEYLTKQQLAELITYLDYEISYDIISKFNVQKQINILDLMEIDDCVDLLQVYQKKEDEKFSYILSKLKDFKIISKLLKYKKNQTGAFISNEIVIIKNILDVKQASLEMIKQAPNAENISTIYVIDENNKFLGLVDFKKLVKARYPLTVNDLYTEVKTVKDIDDVEISANILNLSGLYEIPVVNEENELQGVLALDDVLDIIQQEAEEDINKLALLPNKESSSIFITAFKRVPWLLLLIFLSIPTALMNSFLISQLRTIPNVAVTLFSVTLPLMLDSPGNVGTQTLAMSLIRLSRQGNITLKQAFSELRSGLLTAIFMSVITIPAGFLFILTVNSSALIAIQYSLILSFSILCALCISPIIGMLIPTILKKIKLDPATASGPIITTICDFTSTSIYLSIAIGILKLLTGGSL